MHILRQSHFKRKEHQRIVALNSQSGCLCLISSVFERMLESEFSRVISPLKEESGDEELTVLPRHTKVIVTGNNRTKSVLVGLQGVVKKAVGLGGWHWLVLKNGIEVKLQRNALSVLEPPTGNEEDDDLDNSSGTSCLADKDNDFNFATSVEINKLDKPRVRHARTWATSGPIKSTNRNTYKEFQSVIHTPRARVNLGKLGSNSLWRYWRRFHLGRQNSCSSKEQMVGIVERHFAAEEQVDEVQVIMDFIRRAKRLKKMDRNRA